jgi:hypothetical protein
MPQIAGHRLGRIGLTRGDIGGSLQPGKISPTLPYSETFFQAGLCTLLEVFFLNRTILSKP